MGKEKGASKPSKKIFYALIKKPSSDSSCVINIYLVKIRIYEFQAYVFPEPALMLFQNRVMDGWQWEKHSLLLLSFLLQIF